MVPAEQQWDAEAHGEEYDGVSMKAQTRRRHVKTRAEKTEASDTFSRSRYTAFSRSRATDSETWGRPRARDKEKQSTEHVKGSSV